MSKLLTIPFSQRAVAFENGAVFVRGDFFKGTKNTWEMSSSSEEEPTSLAEYQQEVVEERINKEKENFEIWRPFLEERCTLDIAKALGTYGVPLDKQQRVQMLKILNAKEPGQYRITWEHLITYSPDFAEKYGWDKYMEIAKEKNLGRGDYLVEVESNGLTEEEKALVLFIFPLDI